MPTLHVELFEGRTHAQKSALARELTDACLRVLGGTPDAVDVIFHDVAPGNWATAGLLWSEKIGAQSQEAEAEPAIPRR